MMKKMGGDARSASGLRLTTALSLVLGAAAFATPALAQDATDAASEEIVVTALKHGERNVQDVPVAITAFGAEQLDALNFNDLQSLTYTIPNVQLEDIGTSPGVANFGIRGLGINSSIPSVDPTVGVFIDGMYIGINSGVLTDNFDLAGIEVLRGPQGVLFGRNVTGGAIVMRTRAPTDELEVHGRVAVETGLNYFADLSVSGPIAPGILSGKIAAYWNEDEGWFENDFDGSQHGASEQNILRGALRLTPSNNFEMILRAEQGEANGDGPAAQNHALFSRDSFDFAINNRGFFDGSWEQAILETNWDVGFGDGTITNIYGWRDYEGRSGGDIDAFTISAFHSRALIEQDQWSNELRYAGTFGPVDLVAGHYMFEQNLLYIEERALPALGLPAPRVGGGDGEFSTWGVFANADWHLTDELTLNLGVRYTHEEKEARVSRIRAFFDNLDGAVVVPGEFQTGGSIDAGTLVFSDTPFDLSWNDTSPRVGLQWQPTPDTNIYAFAARGFRSGGVNFRVTTFGIPPCPAVPVCSPGGTPQPPTAFDSEQQTSYEIGWKQDFMNGRGRLNLAIFHNEIDDMQRETNLPGPSGVQQVIVNAGDATIQGAEMEFRFNFTDNFLMQLQAGYTDGEYDRLIADISGDTFVTAADYALEIPRLAPWTYGVSFLHDLEMGFGTLSSRVSYNHRDANFYTDNNRGVLNEADIFDANFTFRPNEGPWSLSLYGNNLTDEATFGGDTQLPDIPQFGGDGAGPRPTPTFSPLNKGRVIGVELSFDF
ncbi:MAG TPA: TonB-dependent receptor [Vitreimonas sp.]|uniref:TonB-dependent receptor n=1 Tax=Vitreimonas sp. TaxID=3069702 RepID=UPI002D65A613|nr:TonB-dependent receptor [Vitreimonas sp.]HYD88781.1 TonB-dependent receptor [Vitreimonas sp.]